MKEFNGTKGNWVRESSGRGIGPVSKEDDQSYGMVIPVAYLDFAESDEVQNANAKLISAAPDMLQALQAALPWLPNCDDEVLHLVESAISKALGEE